MKAHFYRALAWLAPIMRPFCKNLPDGNAADLFAAALNAAATTAPPPSRPPAAGEWTGRMSADFAIHAGGFVRIVFRNHDTNDRVMADMDLSTAKRFGKNLFRACLERELQESDDQ